MTKSPVVEVGLLEHRQWSVFDDQSRVEEKKKKKKEQSPRGGNGDGRTHAEWPPLRKTGRRLVSPEPGSSKGGVSKSKTAGKEHSKSKGHVKKKQDS